MQGQTQIKFKAYLFHLCLCSRV